MKKPLFKALGAVSLVAALVTSTFLSACGGEVAPDELQIIGVTAVDVTDTTATIIWATDLSATSQVEYGTTTGYGDQTTLITTGSLSHSVSLTDLTPDTTYNYRVKSTTDELSETSGNKTFKTEAVPVPPALTILAVTATVDSDTAVTVTWVTNRAATSQVEYGATTAYGEETTETTTLASEHSVELTGLTPGSTYHYRVKSADADDISAVSVDRTFNTTELAISDVEYTATNRGATITWTTDDPATSQVAYGATSSYGMTTPLISTLVTSHSVTIDELPPETDYHYQVLSTTATDDAETADATLTTGDEVTFTLGTVGTAATSENPFLAAQGSSSASHFSYMYEPLVYTMNDGRTLPALADSWEYDADTKVWTITLNPDAEFSNGDPVTAADVKFTLDKMMNLGLGQVSSLIPIVKQNTGGATSDVDLELKDNDPAADTIVRTTGSFVDDGFTDGMLMKITGTIDGPDKGKTGDQDGAYLIGTVEPLVITLDATQTLNSEAAKSGMTLATTGPAADAIVVVDDTTFTITVDTFHATFMRFLGYPTIVPESIWGDMTNVEIMSDPNEDPIGSGPFSLVERTPGSHIIYSARLDYWKGAPYVDTYIRKLYDNDEAQLLAVKLGDIDGCSSFQLPSGIPQLVEVPEITVRTVAPNATLMLYPNHRIEPWGLKGFRQAVSIVLDRTAMVSYAADGWGAVPAMIERDKTFPDVPESIHWAYEDNTQPERIDLANAALDAITGMSQTPDAVDGVVPAFTREYNGTPLAFNCMASDWTEHTTLATLAKANLVDVGIDITLEILTTTQVVDNVYRQSSDATLADWDLHIWGRAFVPEYDYFADQWGYNEINDRTERYTIVGWSGTEAEAIGTDLNTLQTLAQDSAERDALIASTVLGWAEELPAIPLYHTLNPNVARNDRFSDWVIDASMNHYGSVENNASVLNVINVKPIYST